MCNKRRLTASDYQEGNRRDYSISGNQTSSKEGGAQYVVTVVCMYIYLISYMSDSKERLKLAFLPLANCLVLYFLSYTLTQYY